MVKNKLFEFNDNPITKEYKLIESMLSNAEEIIQ